MMPRLTHPLLLLCLVFSVQMCSVTQGDDADGGAAIDSGLDAPPVQSCKTLADCQPPPSGCSDYVSLQYFTADSCTKGRCVFSPHKQDCGYSCVAGGCINSGTAGGGPASECKTAADCAPGPPPYCSTPDTLTYYDAACDSGSCVFAVETRSCPCAARACKTEGGADAEPDAPGDAAGDAVAE